MMKLAIVLAMGLVGAQPAWARGVVELSLGAEHSCALLDDGSVRCWGANDSGQLGLGDVDPRGDVPGEMGASLAAVNLGAGVRVKQIAAGGKHTCALLETGAIKCWGLNSSGQLGLGDNRPRGTTAASMGSALLAVSLGTGRTALSVALGESHTCALLDNRQVKCWGLNAGGQLGLGDNRARGQLASDMGDALPALDFGARVPVAIAVGKSHSCAILRSGQAQCWGTNNAGQLGIESIAAVGVLPGSLLNGDVVMLGAGVGATRITAAEDFTCIETNLGRVQCFGQNSDGRLGLGDAILRGAAPGTMGARLPAVLVEPGLEARNTQCGKSGCCTIIGLTGALKCWGANEEGQLGLEDKVPRGVAPDQMGLSLPFVELGKLARVAQVAVGATHACVLLENGAVKCWGKNSFGQLGIGSRNSVGDLPASMGGALAETRLF